MSELKNLTLAIGFSPAAHLTPADLDRFVDAVSQVSRTVAPRATAFWADEGDGTLNRREIMKAALFENYRQPIDALLIVQNVAALTPANVATLVERLATLDGGGCAALRRSAAGSSPLRCDLALLSAQWLCRIAECQAPASWFPMSNGCGPDRAFLSYLIDLGCPVIESESPEAESKRAADPSRLPRRVHFLPPAAVAETAAPIGEASARIGAALNAIASLPANQRVAIYGAGVVGRAVLPLLGDRVAFVIDRNPDTCGGRIAGVPVVAPSAVSERLAEIAAILITVVGREPEIRAALTGHLGAAASGVQIIDLQRRPASATAAAEAPQDPRRLKVVTPSAPTVTDAFEIPADLPKAPVRGSDLPKTIDRTITRRAVLYVGYPCNIKCKFCYYAYNEDNRWHPLEECKRDADLYRTEYGNDCVDITGGEPTIYPHIYDLVEHCATIGLRPSIITNMQVLRDEAKVRRLKDRGAYDLLCSIHGLGEAYNLITGTPKGWDNIVRAVRHFGTVGMRWRANCTLVNSNMRQLRHIAAFAYEHGARAINFISYNPFYEWASVLEADFQARHSEIAPYLIDALEYCDEVGLEANVRYAPLCQLRGHEEKVYNYPQLSYDHHEWDYCSWYSEATANPSSKVPKWLTRVADDRADLHFFLANRNKQSGFAAPPQCAGCAVRLICDGPTLQYARRYGTEELRPYAGPVVDDPTHFIRRQPKIVDLP